MSNPLPSDSTFTLLQQLVRALDDKKVGDLCVLKVAAKSTITDYIVLATGNSEPHLRALRIEVERVLDDAKHPIAGMEVGTYGSGWTVVDAYQIMTHLFTPEQRANYALEKLWKDAQVLKVADLIAQPKPVTKPVKAGKAIVKKAAPVKKAAIAKKASVKAKPLVKKAVAKKKATVATKKITPKKKSAK